MTRQVSRRTVLRGGTVAAAAAAAVGTSSACDLLSLNPSGSDEGADGGADPASNPKEAPMLAALVEEGKLEPVDKRLPPEPMVVEPADRIGTYGGEWKLLGSLTDAGDGGAQGRRITAGYENLVRWDLTFDKIIPNVAEEWHASEDGTEYTFTLRRGILWSDGEPFTADDVVFAVDDVGMNTDLSPIPPFGEMSIEELDDYTFVLRFAEPNGLFLPNLATERGRFFTQYARHYLETFHKKYNPDADRLAREEQLDDWMALFQRKADTFGTNVDQPILTAWTLASNNQSEVILERNPYYWKVDPQGSQLPYLDRVRWQLVNDEEAALLKIANGEADFSYQKPTDKPVLAQSRSKGDYRFFDAVPAYTSEIAIYLNLAHRDENKRALFQDKDFRIGLSHAINRAEIIDTVYQRQGEPWQIAPRKESSYYDEEMATQYTEYDVDLANRHLDRVAPERNAAGIRLGPDGEPIKFQVDVNSDATTWLDAMDLVVGYWKKVGIDASVNTISSSLVITRGEANEHDAAVWAGEGGLDAVILVNPYNYLPTNPPYSFFGVPWCTWYETDGAEGEEPPEMVRHQLDLYDQIQATTDPNRQHELMTEILHSCKEQFVGIGICAPTSAYGTVANRLQNFPEHHVTGTVWVYMDPAATNPCQLFVED